MKILHTGDWHIGQLFYEYERTNEHVHFLSRLKDHVKKERADVLLIAGDVFDSPNPSAESQAMYYGFLRELTAENPQIQVIVIAGNHDSAARLEAPNPLLQSMNIHVRGIVRRTPQGEIDTNWLTIPLMKDGRLAAYCLAVPYLRRGDTPPAGSHAESVGALYKYLLDSLPDKTKPVIAMGHLYATGSELSGNDASERVAVGGLDGISPEYLPPEITYIALGHLHRAQSVNKNAHIRYAGSPLPMSFSEKNNRQSIVSIELSGNETQIQTIHFPATVQLISIPDEPASPEKILEELSFLPQGQVTDRSPFLEIKVKITEPEPSLRFHIEEALKNKDVRLAAIVPFLPARDKDSPALTFEEIRSISPFNVAMDVFARRFGGETMPEAMQQLLQFVIRDTE